jgi:hypothetical protein
MLIHAVNVGHREIAAPDAGLVGHDEQFEARAGQPFQAGGRGWKNFNIFGTAQIILFGNHRPVAVKENSPVHLANCGWFLAIMELNFFRRVRILCGIL